MTDDKEEKGLEIRDTLEADIDALITLENVCFDAYYSEHRFTRAEFRHYVHNEDTICLSAISGFSVVGYVAGVVKHSRSRLMATVDSIAVLARFRRKGFGSRLLGALIREAKRRGCVRISLFVALPNKAGIEFFAKHGFKRLRTIASYYGGGVDGLLMVSDIS